MENIIKTLKEIGKIKENGVAINTTEEYKEVEEALKKYCEQEKIIELLKELIYFGKPSPKVEPTDDDKIDIISSVSMRVQRQIDNEERKMLRDWIIETCFPKHLEALKVLKKYLALNIVYENGTLPSLIVHCGKFKATYEFDNEHDYLCVYEALKDE